MRKKIAISTAVASLLLIAIITSVLATNLTLSQNITNLNESQETPKLENSKICTLSRKESSPTLINENDVQIAKTPDEIEEQFEKNIENLQETVPRTYEEADSLLCSHRIRFLLYTHDGKHIMWGFVGNNYFVGQDNLGKRCWGIYGNGVFAGFYNSQFFWGRYRSGNWKAEGLFETNYTYGKYILFPTTNTEPTIAATSP
jgi:hypothetical protein